MDGVVELYWLNNLYWLNTDSDVLKTSWEEVAKMHVL